MGYELSVSEVGAAEYPLMEVLRDTIFSELGHVHRCSLADDLADRKDVFALIAHLEGNPVGYKVGYRFIPGVFYSKSGGILKEYRHNGLARQMQSWQHGWLRARGYKEVFFNTFNRFTDMIRLSLDSGFLPIAAQREFEGELSFKFAKDLTLPDPIRLPKELASDVRVQRVGEEYRGIIAAMASLADDSQAENHLAAEMARAGTVSIVAFIAQKPAGYAVGRGTEDGSFRTSALGIVDTYRRKGAEEMLTAHLLEYAQELGCANLCWDVPQHDVKSLQIALDAGYQFTGLYNHQRNNPTFIMLERPITP